MIHHDAHLNIEAADLCQVTGISAVTGDKLGDNSEHLGGVHSKTGPRPKEVGLTETIGVQIAAILNACR